MSAPRLANLAREECVPIPTRDQTPDPTVLLAFLRSRRSMRRYRSQPVERDMLEMLIRAGRYAPTGQNRQSLGYVVLQTPEIIARVRRLAVAGLLEQADRLDAALDRERAGGPPLDLTDQPWRDYPAEV